MNEFQLIKKYFSKLSKNNLSALGLSDDVFFDQSKQLVISVDTYVEGIHFFNFKKPELVIKKIIRSSISDLICKGVKPKYYFVSGSGQNKNFSSYNLIKIVKSLKEEQNKFGILLCGGDTVFSEKLSFTIISVGFSNNIIKRNNAKINDDIYVTGNLGDSFVGLSILKKKIKVNRYLKRYFEKKYYLPELQIGFTKKLLNLANTSIDISDGLIADLEKLIKLQKLSYNIYIDKIPISPLLNKLLSVNKFKKKNFISRGDDYQILFTADSSKSRIINKTAKSLGIKISKIGKICSNRQKSQIFDKNGVKTTIRDKGYYHRF